MARGRNRWEQSRQVRDFREAGFRDPIIVSPDDKVSPRKPMHPGQHTTGVGKISVAEGTQDVIEPANNLTFTPPGGQSGRYKRCHRHGNGLDAKEGYQNLVADRPAHGCFTGRRIPSRAGRGPGPRLCRLMRKLGKAGRSFIGNNSPRFRSE